MLFYSLDKPTCNLDRTVTMQYCYRDLGTTPLVLPPIIVIEEPTAKTCLVQKRFGVCNNVVLFDTCSFILIKVI